MKHFLFFCVLQTSCVFSQTDSSRLARHLIYMEIGGPVGYGSLNYEHIICSQKPLMIALRAGLSSYHFRDYNNRFNPDLLIPLLLEAIYGNTHKVEAGFGQTITSIVHVNVDDTTPQRKLGSSSVFSIGYRYQKNSGGLLFRIAYTPILEFNRSLRHWAGISIGHSF